MDPGSGKAICLRCAAIARGEIEVESANKPIQHLEGGLVTKIFVKEAQAVKKGQAETLERGHITPSGKMWPVAPSGSDLSQTTSSSRNSR